MNLHDIRKNIINELYGIEQKLDNCKEYEKALELRDNIIYLADELDKIDRELWKIENMEA